ncbi:MAG: type II secretion system protein GspH [Deltaproteobacteria bacterium]|nr:MAG: type II secretion system protein GspH [Deltaproteobacteria bacterium]
MAWKGAREILLTSTAGAERRGFTLLELVVTLAVIALAAGLVLPRLGDARGLELGAAARRLADTLAYARDRAILGGRPMRLVLDLDRGRWDLGTPARDPVAVIADFSPLGRGAVLPAGVRLAAVTAGGTPAATRGIAALDLEPDGDALPARIDLADASGRRASVVVPPAGGRPVVQGPSA